MSMIDSFREFEKAYIKLVSIILEKYDFQYGLKHGDHDQSTHGRGGGAQKEWEGGLSAEQQKSFASYTGKGYKRMRKCQNAGKGCNPTTKEDIGNIEKALESAPLVEGVVYRGLSFPKGGPGSREDYKFKSAMMDAMHDGSDFETKGFTSTTSDIKTAREFAGAKDQSMNGYILQMKTKSGVDVTNFSKFEESEVLLGKGTKFKVLDVDGGINPGMTTFVLEEV